MTHRRSGEPHRETQVYPDGTTVTLTQGPHPVFGMLAAYTQQAQAELSSGHEVNAEAGLLQDLVDPDDLTAGLLSAESSSTLIASPDRSYISTWDRATSSILAVSPEGRYLLAELNQEGLLAAAGMDGLTTASFNYDSAGRLTSVSRGSGPSEREATIDYFDAEGEVFDSFVEKITDPIGREVEFEYNDKGQLTTQTLPGGRVVAYTYDDNWNVLTVTPPGKPAHTFEYNQLDQLKEEAPPEIGLTDFVSTATYNFDHTTSRVFEPDGTSVTFNYNFDLGLLDSYGIERGEYVFLYDDINRLEEASGPDDDSYIYDYDGPLYTSGTWSNGADDRAIAYEFADEDLRLTSYTLDLDNFSTTVEFSYDDDDLVTSIGLFELAYNPLNALLTTTTLNDIVTTYTYNEFGEVTTATVMYQNDLLYNCEYAYDKLGRIEEKVETIDGETTTTGYAYTIEGFLEEVEENNVVTATYVYDQNGNRLRKITPGAIWHGVYDDQDRLTAYGDGSSTTTYTYNNKGQLYTQLEPGDAYTTYTYDQSGNLLRVVTDATTVTYTIDANDNRIARTFEDGGAPQIRQWYYGDGMSPFAELDENGDVESHFVGPYFMKNDVAYRIVRDHLGSPRLIVDIDDGSIVQRLDYDEFGDILQDTNPEFQPAGFVGGHYDTETGLTRFGMRDYDPVTGRWLSKEPIGFAGSLNFYAYCSNDPVNYVDIDGLQQQDNWQFDAGDGWRVESGHGGTHIQYGTKYRWDAKTLQPIGHKGKTPLPLTSGQRQILMENGVFTRILDRVPNSALHNLSEADRLLIRNCAKGVASKAATKSLAKSLFSKLAIPITVAFFISDYKEGGAEKAIKNAVVPGELIEEYGKDKLDKANKKINKKKSDYYNTRYTVKGIDMNDY